MSAELKKNVKECIQHKRFDMFDILMRNNEINKSMGLYLCYAGMYGHIDFIKHILCNYKNSYILPRHFGDVIYFAATEGQLETVKWLHTNTYAECTTDAMDDAARNGHLDVVKWLHENRTEGCTTAAMDFAAKNGHLDVVKWLHENRTEGCTVTAIGRAAINGHTDVVKFLHENRTEGCYQNTIDFAAGYGHLEVVKFLHENSDVGCSIAAFHFARQLGQTEVLQFLYNNYKQLVTKVNDETYKKLLPFIQEDFEKVFRKIEKENIVREFLAQKLVYHPLSCYMKRIVKNF